MPRHSDGIGYLIEIRDQENSPFFSKICDLAISSSSSALTETQLETEPGQVVSNSINHLAEAMLPFSYPQIQRIYQAATDKPSERGEFFELPDELLGYAGFRAVKLDPVKSLVCKLAEYQRGLRESRRLFTGGDEGLLKGVPKTPQDVVKRFIQANKARFLTQQKLVSLNSNSVLRLLSWMIGLFDRACKFSENF